VQQQLVNKAGGIMETIILAVHVILAIGIIALVMLQQGKGAEAGASFGGGASQTVFGSQGSGSVLSRSTAILATGLFLTSFALAFYAKQQASQVSGVGIPSAAIIEQQAESSDLPVLDEKPAVAPVDSDIPETE
jgi:preprotein translocase subunit SecG